MPDREPALDEAVHQIARLRANAYLHLRFPVQKRSGLDAPETPEPSWDGGLMP